MKPISRTTILSAIYFFFPVCLVAQQIPEYYFNDFTPGRVLLKNKQFARGKFNYDFANHQMHFLNGTTDMIVENLADIDTILIDKVRFVPYEKRFVEVLRSGQSTLFVDRKLVTRERGRQGAMGITTHGSVQAIDVNTRFQRVNGEHNTDLNVYKEEVEYTYWLPNLKKGKMFHNSATFVKLFPKSVQQAIRERIKEQDTNFSNPESVLKLVDTLHDIEH